MTQADRPEFLRSDVHDDAVLTGPIPGLPVSTWGSTPPRGTHVPREHARSTTPHPSGPLPVPVARVRRRWWGIAAAGLVLVVVGALLAVASVGPPAWALGGLGLVLGGIGLRRSAHRRLPGRLGRARSLSRPARPRTPRP